MGFLNSRCPGSAATAGALRDNLRVRFQRVAVEYRLWEFDVSHPQITDRGAQASYQDAHPDHDAERIEAAEQPLAEFGIFGEMRIDMQGLRFMVSRLNIVLSISVTVLENS
jgi:hypothetical protein